MNQNNCGQGLERKGLGSKMGADDVNFVPLNHLGKYLKKSGCPPENELVRRQTLMFCLKQLIVSYVNNKTFATRSFSVGR